MEGATAKVCERGTQTLWFGMPEKSKGWKEYGKGMWETHPCHTAWAACRVNGIERATVGVI